MRRELQEGGRYLWQDSADKLGEFYSVREASNDESLNAHVSTARRWWECGANRYGFVTRQVIPAASAAWTCASRAPLVSPTIRRCLPVPTSDCLNFLVAEIPSSTGICFSSALSYGGGTTHLHVHDDDVPAGGAPREEQVERLLPVVRGLDDVAGLLELAPHDFAVHLVVVDRENA